MSADKPVDYSRIVELEAGAIGRHHIAWFNENLKLMTPQRSNTTTITSHIVQPLVGRCEQCGDDVVMVTPEYAAAVMRVPPDKLFGLVASGKLHSLEKPSGILICCGSVPLTSQE